MTTAQKLLTIFEQTRTRTEEICSYLETEDYSLQPMLDVSPPKWHLGHTSWFFEEFVLLEAVEHYQVFDPRFAYVFNSYYESKGDRAQRKDRGIFSRPTVREVYQFRKHVTEAVLRLLGDSPSRQVLKIVELGCEHEKQHQELLLTDIKFILGNNPLHPVYHEGFEENPIQDFPQDWVPIEEGIYNIGHHQEDRFCYDNELGYHKVFLSSCEISSKLVTNQEFLAFMEDGGYAQPLLWHSEAWEWIRQHGIHAPLYWHRIEDSWHQYTLGGIRPLELAAPLSHISYFEAFAFAQWKGYRLPTEFEWESAQQSFDWGTRWEWTESAYLPYPRYRKAPGALGEYNGKFMVNQKVLRGGSVATASGHTRYTYRNFFHPHLRWQFTGIRLAK